MNEIIFSTIFGVIMMFCSVFVENKSLVKHIASACLALLLLVNIAETYNWYSIHIDTNNLLTTSKFGLYFNSIAILSTLILVSLNGSDVEKLNKYSSEYFALFFFVLCGVGILSSFNSLLTLFIGVEIMTIPLYILTGSDKKNLKSNEASLKYFLMGSFSTGIMLMGIALIYGITGNFSLDAPVAANFLGTPVLSILSPVGLLFIFCSLLFKVSAAPFHFWTPDVYDGAPSVFTSFMSTIVKAAGFIALIHLFDLRSNELGLSWKILLPVIIIATLLIGNITAVFQQSVKRMLAYSSIAQAGFMLFAVYNNNDLTHEGILLYSVAYSFATIGIFSILIKMSDYSFEGYNGLAKKEPVLAFANTVFLLSLAGIPLTAGFFAKYYMLSSALKNSGTSVVWLVVVAVLFAAVSVYYYFKVIQAMYFKEGDDSVSTIDPVTSSFKIKLILLAAAIILIGIMPNIVTNYLYF